MATLYTKCGLDSRVIRLLFAQHLRGAFTNNRTERGTTTELESEPNQVEGIKMHPHR